MLFKKKCLDKNFIESRKTENISKINIDDTGPSYSIYSHLPGGWRSFIKIYQINYGVLDQDFIRIK